MLKDYIDDMREELEKMKVKHYIIAADIGLSKDIVLKFINGEEVKLSAAVKIDNYLNGYTK